MFIIILSIFNPDIAFDGWATAILILILTLILTALGIGTNQVVKKRKIRQSQKAGNGATQNQTIKQSSVHNNSKIVQTQKANENSTQNQTA